MQQEGDGEPRNSSVSDANNLMLASQRTHITELTAENDGIDADEICENDLNDFINNVGNMDID